MSAELDTVQPRSAFGTPLAGPAPDTTAEVLKRKEIAIPKRSNLGERLVSLFSPVLLLVLWELLVRVRLLDARFFPAPTSIVGTFNTLLLGPQHELLVDIKATLGRIAVRLIMRCIP